jgi:hypothetical protein
MGIPAGAKPCGARRAERLGRAQAGIPIERRPVRYTRLTLSPSSSASRACGENDMTHSRSR